MKAKHYANLTVSQALVYGYMRHWFDDSLDKFADPDATTAAALKAMLPRGTDLNLVLDGLVRLGLLKKVVTSFEGMWYERGEEA
jgi:hypothetical protein